ncbi:MAG: hypothetical protein ACR2FY_27025, partial [Pirellulaceae bacterium]
NLIQSLLGHVGAPREGLVTQTLRKPHVPSFFYHPARASVGRARRSADEVEKEIRRIVERAIRDLREDSAAFGLPNS